MNQIICGPLVIILSSSADASICDVDDKTSLHIAFSRNCPGKVIKMMLDG
jgi:hypothetical protein